jgi:predicted esterase
MLWKRAMPRTTWLIVALLVALGLVRPSFAEARGRASHGPYPWCASEFETLPNGLCHIPGAPQEGRRTLVIFLHGMIAPDVDWQWTQERALARQAKQSKFEAIFAKAPLGAQGYAWPGSAAAMDDQERALLDAWEEARHVLERRHGKPFDEVFLMGFSSGAYFTSALALRGRGRFDGFATFAGGGGGWRPDARSTARPPVFVGVCADDAQTRTHSRSFGNTLAALGWPHRVDEQPIGHMFGDVHVAHAIGYLRATARAHR